MAQLYGNPYTETITLFMKCPGCGKEIVFYSPTEINVNCESKGTVKIKNMFHLVKKCDNPLCEWSKIRVIT